MKLVDKYNVEIFGRVPHAESCPLMNAMRWLLIFVDQHEYWYNIPDAKAVGWVMIQSGGSEINPLTVQSMFRNMVVDMCGSAVIPE